MTPGGAVVEALDEDVEIEVEDALPVGAFVEEVIARTKLTSTRSKYITGSLYFLCINRKYLEQY